MTRRYRAFISYSWADKAWAGWLHRSLETYRPPKSLVGKETDLGPVPNRLHPIFKDREEEAAGHGISASIESAMADSDFLIVVCSPRSVRSKWVNREIAWFKTHRSKQRILALVIDGEPGASLAEGKPPHESSVECFPEALLYKVDAQLQPTREAEDLPLAADARKQGDGKRLARLKLAAALLGLGLDDLVKRDERRRAARLRWMVAGLGSVAAIMTGLFIVAVQQRDFAREMQSAAEAQRNQAEGLVEFMIGDLRHKLEGDVQLDVLADIATRAQDYYVIQTAMRMDDDALGRRVRVLDLLGDLKQDFGDSDAAADLLRQSVEASAELLRRDPDNPQRIIEQAHSVQGLGSLSFQRGDVAGAETYMRQAVELTTRLRALEPDNPEWAGEQGSALVNLGIMRLNSNSLAEAANSFREAVAIKQAAIGDAHDVGRARYDLSLTLAWLAQALLRQGDIAGAQLAWLEEDAVISDMLTEDATNNAVLRRRAVNRINRAEAHLNANEYPAAQELAYAAVDDAEAVLAADASNTRGVETVARAQLLLGNALLAVGNIDAAAAASERADLLVNQLIDIDADRYQWSGALRGSSQILNVTVAARAATNLRACRSALGAIGPEADRLEALAIEHPDDTGLGAIAGRALMLKGDAFALSGNDIETHKSRASANAIVLLGDADLNPRDPATQRVLEELEQRGRADATTIENLLCGGN